MAEIDNAAFRGSLARVEQPHVDRARLDRVGGAERLDLRKLERGGVALRTRPEVEERDAPAPPLSTLLKEMLDRYSELAVPSES